MFLTIVKKLKYKLWRKMRFPTFVWTTAILNLLTDIVGSQTFARSIFMQKFGRKRYPGRFPQHQWPDVNRNHCRVKLGQLGWSCHRNLGTWPYFTRQRLVTRTNKMSRKVLFESAALVAPLVIIVEFAH